MKDLILVKVSKNKEENNLKKEFQKNNISTGVNDVDSVNNLNNPNFKHLKFYNRLNILNKILFNLSVFAIFILFTFLVIIILSIASETLSVKNKVLASGNSGLKALELAKDDLSKLDTENSLYYFKLASKYFEEADKEYSKIKLLTTSASVIPFLSEEQQNAKHIINLGKSISSIGIEITEISREVSNFKNKDINNLIQNIEKHYFLINGELKSAENSLGKINTKHLDLDIAKKIEKAKASLPEIKKYLSLAESFYKKIPEIVGFEEEKNYLIVFQNNNEMRSTGGFIGSFGVLKIKDSEIKDFFVDDIYRLDDKYKEAIKKGQTPYIPPPYPMDPNFIGSWSLRSSNNNPDFRESAKTIIDFYKKEVPFAADKKYPQKVDGVISITPTVLEQILDIVGPITIEDYGMSVNSKNLLETLQIEIETGKDKQAGKNPKTILELLKNKLMIRLSSLNQEESKKIVFSLINKLDEKHIILYSENSEVQRFFAKLQWTGEIKKAENEDFLMIINNNYGGTKSSLKVNENIEQEINIKDDGSITKNIKITREHTSDYFFKYIDPWTKEELWLIGDNKNYIKIYVPRGSKMIKAEGFDKKIDIYTEGDKTAFGSNFTVVPKQKKEAILSYELPFKVKTGDLSKYFLLIQKQPGSIGSNIETKINLPNGTKIKNISTNLDKKSDTQFSGILSLDRFISVFLSP